MVGPAQGLDRREFIGYGLVGMRDLGTHGGLSQTTLLAPATTSRTTKTASTSAATATTTASGSLLGNRHHHARGHDCPCVNWWLGERANSTCASLIQRAKLHLCFTSSHQPTKQESTSELRVFLSVWQNKPFQWQRPKNNILCCFVNTENAYRPQSNFKLPVIRVHSVRFFDSTLVFRLLLSTLMHVVEVETGCKAAPFASSVLCVLFRRNAT